MLPIVSDKMGIGKLVDDRRSIQRLTLVFSVPSRSAISDTPPNRSFRVIELTCAGHECDSSTSDHVVQNQVDVVDVHIAISVMARKGVHVAEDNDLSSLDGFGVSLQTLLHARLGLVIMDDQDAPSVSCAVVGRLRLARTAARDHEPHERLPVSAQANQNMLAKRGM